MSDTIERITQYLSKGGLFNPEMAMHERVSELLIDCREELLKGESVRRKLVGTHIKSDELQERLSAAEAKVDALMRQLHAFYDICSECGGNGYGPDRAYGSEVHQDKCSACNGEGRVSKVDALMREKEELRQILAYWAYECSGQEPSLSVFNRMVDRALVREQQNTTQEDLNSTADLNGGATNNEG